MYSKDFESQFPKAEGLYDPAFEHDACGVGLIADIKGTRSHNIVRSGREMLMNLSHRGAVGSDPETGDSAGILMQIPHTLYKQECSENGIHLPDAGQYAVGMLY